MFRNRPLWLAPRAGSLFLAALLVLGAGVAQAVQESPAPVENNPVATSTEAATSPKSEPATSSNSETVTSSNSKPATPPNSMPVTPANEPSSNAVGEPATKDADSPVAAAPTLAPSSSFGGNHTSGSATLMSVLMALGAVVLMIFVTAWVIKRFTGLSPLNNKQIKVVAALPVGARERLLLVDVGGQQLLLGVTPQQITTLYQLEEPLAMNDRSGTSDFAQRLQAMLSKGNS